MEQKKRKISVRKILQLLLTVVVTTGCIIAIVGASKIEGDKYLSNVAVHIKNGKKYHFIEQNEIMDLAINNRHVDIMHTPLADLDVHAIEQVIKSDPWVADAQAFIDMNRVLNMYVTQRIPVARIFQQDAESYYMDATLNTMPLSRNYIFYTTVVTNVPGAANDSTGWGLKKQIYSLVKTIQSDTFWNAQISQVIVDSPGMFELVPVLGNQKIVFGDTSAAREKLDNLFAFYKNVLNRIGWDKYETLDLRFNNQVVASPSLPYKGPVDKAVDKMNWINSIIITEAQNDTKDSLKTADINNITTGFAGSASKAADVPGAQKSMPGAISKTAVVAGAAGAGILLAKQLKKPAPSPVTKKTAAPVAKPKVNTIQAKQKPGTKIPPKQAGKAITKAKQAGKAKPTDKKKAAAKAKDKKKAKAPAKNAKGKPAPKKAVKPVVAKSDKDKKANKDNNTKQAAPKYAYPDSKGH